MKKVFLIYAVLIIAILVVYFGFLTKVKINDDDSKIQAITVSSHSDEFNQSAEKMMNAYYQMTESFVKWDSATVNQQADELKSAVDNLKLDDLKKDTLIYETAVATWESVKTEMQNLISQTTLETKRRSLNSFSNQLYDLLRIIHFDTGKIYLQECPMAFNDDESGNWLSKTDEVRNPYLGIHHPKYKSGMLNCGGPKDTLNFIPADTKK